MHKVSFTFIGLACASVMVAQPRYEVVDLTERYGQFFTPQNINNAGQIGASLALKAPSQACVVEPDGSLRFLPRYKGQTWVMTELADNGDALGHDTFGTFEEHTILFHEGKVVDIDVQGALKTPAGLGVNSLGQVVGQDFGNRLPFIWENGKTTYLPTVFPVGNQPSSINDAGMIAGIGATLQSGPLAVRWVNGVQQQINPPWAISSRVEGISENGEIAGWGSGAILWRKDGSAVDLGDFGGGNLGGKAYDVNNLSQVVGAAQDSNYQFQAFLWVDGEMFRLTDLMPVGHGYNLSHAFSINDAGQILVSGSDTMGQYNLLLNPVPEPSTLVILVCGSITIAIYRWRRRQKQQCPAYLEEAVPSTASGCAFPPSG